MSGNIALDLIISLAGIGILVGLVWWLFPPRLLIVSQTHACNYLLLEEPDFVPDQWLVDGQGRAVLTACAGWQVFIVVCAGASDLIHRRFHVEDLCAHSLEGECLILALDDLTFGTVYLCGANTARWSRHLGSDNAILPV